MQIQSVVKIALIGLLTASMSFSCGQHQSNKAFTLSAENSKTDTSQIARLVKKSLLVQATNADSALIYAGQALAIAKNTNYKTGEANSLNRMGVVLWKNGKYDRALELLLGALKIREEKKDQPGELACLNNIGIIYSDQNDDEKALTYHFKAKAIAESTHNNKFLSTILSNIGNSYIKLNKVNLALGYEMQAYALQQNLGDQGSLSNTLSILGDIHYKMNHRSLAIEYYRLSLNNAEKNNDQGGLADTYNSLAALYNDINQPDSSALYAKKGLEAAQKAHYPIAIFTASSLLTKIYQASNEHLELLYLKTAMAAKDSMFSIEKIKQVQTLSFNEALRQQEIAEQKRHEAEERLINLQLVGIAIFIPVFFLVLLFLSKGRTHRKVIEFMSVLSLLLVFEFITLFIHPFVQRISNHLPVLELAILVALAAVLVPLHHRLTNWLRLKLVHAEAHAHLVQGKPREPAKKPVSRIHRSS
jgi:tetratricopeptide (TPR) repeat protein